MKDLVISSKAIRRELAAAGICLLLALLVNVVYRYRDGVHLVYDSLISNKFYGFEIQVMGPKGTVEGETGKLYVETPPPAPGIVQLTNQLERKLFATIPVGGPSWVPDLHTDTEGTWLSRNLRGDDGSALSMAAFAWLVKYR